MLRELRAWWHEWRSTVGVGLRDSWGGGIWHSGEWGGGFTSASGVVVSEATALMASAVWGAVSTIAGDVASLPFLHYQRTAEGAKVRYDGSKLYRVLHDEFNSEMSAMVGRETLTAHALLWGNGYAEIQRNGLGQVIALWPLTPDRVMPFRTQPFGPIQYRVARADGTQSVISADALFHLVGLGYDGLQGYSVIQKARDSIGVTLAAEALGGATFANGTTYSGFFQHPRSLGATALQHLKESMAKDKPGGYRILEEGMTFVPGSMPLKDAEWLASRKFQVTEICRWFGIPPHKLADLDRTTFSNIEEQNIDYVTWTLRRWLVRWEQEANRKLIAPLEKGIQFTEHLIDGMLRGNVQSRYQAYAMGRNGGWLSTNDIRRFENMNPIEGGDDYLVQGAMVPLARINDLVDAQIAAKSAASSPGVGDQTGAPTPAKAGTPPEDQAPPGGSGGDEANQLPPVVERIVADLTAEVTQRHAALAAEFTEQQAALVAAQQVQHGELVARLATDQAFRDWQQATLAWVAGRFVRRELAQLKKLVASPAELPARLETFYARFVAEGCAELQPLVRRVRPDGAAALHATLAAWATAAQADTLHALGNGGLEGLAVGREDALTQRLWEVCHG